MKLYQSDKVSIIVLTRGDADKLIRTLDSILDQTYKNIEIFLIADDENERYSKKISSYKDKIRYTLRQRSFSKGKVLNDTLKIAHGKYFAVLAAGDIWHLKSLEQKVNFLEKNNSAFAVCCDFDVIGKKGVINDSFFQLKNLFRKIEAGDTFFVKEVMPYLIKSSFRLLSNTLVRNEAYLFHGPFDEDTYDYSDSSLFLKMAKESQLGCINSVLVSRFFDMYKVSYYISENMQNRILYLEDLLVSLDAEYKRYRSDVRHQIKNNYFSLANYLIKSKEKYEARRIATEYIVKHSFTSELLLLFFKTLLPSGADFPGGKYDYFQTERLRNELLKLYL